MGHILHQFDDLTGVIWVIYYTHGRTGHPLTRTGFPATGSSTCTGTRKTCYPFVCKWLLIWRLWPPTLHEKKFKFFFNMRHILHWLDSLTGVICVIMSKRNNILHRLLLRTSVIYSFLSYFEGHISLFICVTILFWICHLTKRNLTLLWYSHVYNIIIMRRRYFMTLKLTFLLHKK